MPVPDLMIEGLKLLLLGMGSVFAFLVALVLAMMLMSRLAAVLDPPEPPVSVQSGTDPSVVAAITAAVARYRSRR